MMENSLRKELGVRKSLQILEELNSPMLKTASPLVRGAGTPAPFLGKSLSDSTSMGTPLLGGRLNETFDSPADSVFGGTPTGERLSYGNNSYLLNQSNLNVTACENVADVSSHAILLEKDPAMEGAGNLFEDFMDLLNQHPHSSDVFTLVERYETTCRAKIKSLLEYINKTDPSRRRLKNTVNLLNQLYRECYTWRLLASLFRDRIDAKPPDETDLHMLPTVDSAKSEQLIVDRLFAIEPSTRQCQIIVDWLEKNMQDKLEDLIESENLRLKSNSMYWEHTVHDLAQLRMKSKDPALANNLVTEIDPDAPLRQQRKLSTLDQQDEEQLLVYMFRFIRAGKLDEAQNLCNEQGHFWRSATLDGWRLWHDPNFFTEDPGDEIMPARGNPDRDLWKINCWALSEETECSVYEKAIYASLSGHLKQILPACSTWEDLLWAHFKVYIDVRVEQEIRNQPRSNGDFLDLPAGYWEQAANNELNPENIIRYLATHPNSDVQRQSQDVYRSFQANIILNEIDALLERMKKTMVASTDDPHLFRCMAHMVLFLQSVGIQTQEEICVQVLHTYVQILIQRKQTRLVAKYTSCLPQAIQTEVYAEFLQSITVDEERRVYLDLGEQAGLDLKQVTKQIVENLLAIDDGGRESSELDEVKINSIQWLLFDESQRGEAVKQANRIVRLFLAAKKFAGAKAVFDLVPGDSVNMIHKQWRRRAGDKPLPAEEDNAIREHFCLKTYMIAHDAFNTWFKHYYDQAPLEPSPPAPDAEFKEQILYEEGLKEYEAEFERWKKTLETHVRTTSNCIYNVFTFPGGWLIDPSRGNSEAGTVPEEESDGRSHQLLVLRQVCIPYLTFLLQNVLHSSKQYRSVLHLAEVIQSKQYKLYEVFQKTELQKYLGLVRDSCVALLEEGYDPFGYTKSNLANLEGAQR